MPGSRGQRGRSGFACSKVGLRRGPLTKWGGYAGYGGKPLGGFEQRRNTTGCYFKRSALAAWLSIAGMGRGKETRRTAVAVIQLRGDGSPEHTVAVRPWTLF